MGPVETTPPRGPAATRRCLGSQTGARIASRSTRRAPPERRCDSQRGTQSQRWVETGTGRPRSAWPAGGETRSAGRDRPRPFLGDLVLLGRPSFASLVVRLLLGA